MKRVANVTVWFLLAVAVAASAGCVERNVERISRDEAASIPPPPAPQGGPASSAQAPDAGAAGQTRISGTVQVADELADRLPANAVLFLVARIAGREGGPPLAVQRHAAPRFPLDFVISEADSMVPNTPLVGDLIITARIDQDGNAMTSTPGDLLGQAGPASAGDTGVVIVLSEMETG